VHVPETPSPLKRLISVTSLFPSRSEVSFRPARWVSSLPLQTLGRLQFELERELVDSELGESVSTASSRIKHARFRFLAFSIAAEHGPQVSLWVAATLTPGDTFSDLVCFTYSVAPVASVEMSVTVDYTILTDVDHLL